MTLKSPFLFVSSLFLIGVITLLGWDLMADMLTAANTLANAGAAFLGIAIVYIDYRIFKFSYKKFIKS